jgi:hypothetical protein
LGANGYAAEDAAFFAALQQHHQLAAAVDVFSLSGIHVMPHTLASCISKHEMDNHQLINERKIKWRNNCLK